MSAHEIVWSLNSGSLRASAICTDPDCINRYQCHEGCELIYDLKRDGTNVSHGLLDWEGEIKPHHRHQMVLEDHCNIVEFLNADADVIAELQEFEETIEIGRTVIEPVWQGEDGLLWRKAYS